MNWKWMMMAGAMGVASMGLAGCGDDDDAPCETSADCGGSEACVGPEDSKVCRTMCDEDPSVCDTDTQTCGVMPGDTSGVNVCNPIDGGTTLCTDDTECAEDEFCNAEGQCELEDVTTGCTSTDECIDQTAYCADIGAGECLDVSCGSDLNDSCTRCTSGPNGGDRAAAGPVIFPNSPAQVGPCVQDTSLCTPGAAPWACKFSFFAFDAEGDLPTSGLSGDTGKIKVLSSSGSEQPIFGTSNTESGSNRLYTFTACFPDTTNGGIGTAAVLRDNANNASNTLCLSGNLPQ